MEIRDLGSALTDEHGGLEILSDSDLDTGVNTAVPEAVITWGETLQENTSSILYIASKEGQFGVLAVNEYDGVTRDNLFSGDASAMRAGMRETAEALAGMDAVKGLQIYTGAGTGFADCDEIAVFIPADISPGEAQSVLAEIDANVYPQQALEMEHGQEQNIGMNMELS